MVIKICFSMLSVVLIWCCSAGAQDERPPTVDDPLPFEWNLLGTVEDEGGHRIANAIVQVPAVAGERFSTTTDENGRFALSFRTKDEFRSSVLLVCSHDGQQRGFSSLPIRGSRDLQRIVLRPTKNVSVHVVDQDDKPVADAVVDVLVSSWLISTSNSDENGHVAVALPADIPDFIVTATRDHVGFDFSHCESLRPNGYQPQLLTLRLNGAFTATVRAEDSAGKPISDVSVSVGRIRKRNESSDVNLVRSHVAKTNHNGEVSISWLPKDLLFRTYFQLTHPDFVQLERPEISKTSPTVTTKLVRLATVRGHVLAVDGTPAAGIRLQATGQGATSFRRQTHSSEDGSYEIDLPPGHRVVIDVVEKNIAAKSITGIALKEGQVNEGQDFRLINGTVIRGVITEGKSRTPVVGRTIILQNIHMAARTSTMRHVRTDKRGQYRFSVSPGTYLLSLPQSKQAVGNSRIELVVDDEEEIVRNAHIEVDSRVALNGTVVDSDMQPVSCVLFGTPLKVRKSSGFRMRIGDDGVFQRERWTGAMVLLATDEARNLAARKTIEDEERDVQLQLRPAVRITGHVENETGQPLPGFRVRVSMLPEEVDSGPITNLYTTTDKDGHYSLGGVLPATRCVVYCHRGDLNATSRGFRTGTAGTHEMDALIVRNDSVD